MTEDDGHGRGVHLLVCVILCEQCYISLFSFHVNNWFSDYLYYSKFVFVRNSSVTFNVGARQLCYLTKRFIAENIAFDWQITWDAHFLMLGDITVGHLMPPELELLASPLQHF